MPGLLRWLASLSQRQMKAKDRDNSRREVAWGAVALLRVAATVEFELMNPISKFLSLFLPLQHMSLVVPGLLSGM